MSCSALTQIQRREPIDLNIFDDPTHYQDYLGSKANTGPVEPFCLLAASDLSLFVLDFVTSSLLCFFVTGLIETVRMVSCFERKVC